MCFSRAFLSPLTLFSYPPCDLKNFVRSSASCPADASRQSRRAFSLSRGRAPDCRLAPALVHRMMLFDGQRATSTLTSHDVSELPPDGVSSRRVMLPSM